MMDTVDRITGSIARVEDQYTVIINRGAEHGVEPDMIFAVLTDGGDQIIDPENGEVIGELPIEKLRVKVFDVQPKYSRASTFRTFVRPGLNVSAMSALASQQNWNEFLRKEMGSLKYALPQGFSERGGLGSLNAALAADLAKPKQVRQRIADADPPTEPEEQPAQAEVAVNIGDKVRQVVSARNPEPRA